MYVNTEGNKPEIVPLCCWMKSFSALRDWITLGECGEIDCSLNEFVLLSATCCRYKAILAAVTRCFSATIRHLSQVHSFQGHLCLCPLKSFMTPWFLHRVHFGDRPFPFPNSIISPMMLPSFPHESILSVWTSLTVLVPLYYPTLWNTPSTRSEHARYFSNL